MRNLLALLPLLAVILAGCAQPAAQDEHAHAEADPMTAGTVLEPPTVMTDFSMASSAGRPISLADLRGKPSLIFFGFTSCPDVCPTTLAEFKRVKDGLGDSGDQVNYVFISVDPQRDTPEVLATYVGAFDPTFIGLQGDEATLRQIGRDYGLFYEVHSPAAGSDGYDVDHSSAAYLADGAGRLRVVYSYGTPHTTLEADVRKLLDE